MDDIEMDLGIRKKQVPEGWDREQSNICYILFGYITIILLII